jgi:hypothetical protein
MSQFFLSLLRQQLSRGDWPFWVKYIEKRQILRCELDLPFE